MSWNAAQSECNKFGADLVSYSLSFDHSFFIPWNLFTLYKKRRARNDLGVQPNELESAFW